MVRLEIESWVGREAFVDRMSGRLDGSRCEVRWTSLEAGGMKDAGARLLDAATFVREHPHPLWPTIRAVLSMDGGFAAVVDPVPPHALHTLVPLPRGAAVAVAEQVARLISEINLARDQRRRRYHVALRSLSSRTIWLADTGDLVVTGFESLGGVWPSRIAKTGLAVGFTEKSLDDDVFDVGFLLYELLLGADAGEALRLRLEEEELANYHRSLDGTIDRALVDDRRLGTLVRRCLAFHADERPTIHELAGLLGDEMSSPSELTRIGSRLGRPRVADPEEHALLGSTWEFQPGDGLVEPRRVQPRASAPPPPQSTGQGGAVARSRPGTGSYKPSPFRNVPTHEATKWVDTLSMKEGLRAGELDQAREGLEDRVDRPDDPAVPVPADAPVDPGGWAGWIVLGASVILATGLLGVGVLVFGVLVWSAG